MGRASLALFLHDLSNRYQLLMRDDAQRVARRHQHDLAVFSAEKDAEIQVRQIRAILDNPGARPAGILVSPVRESALLGIMREALNRGVGWAFLCRVVDSVREMQGSHPEVPVFSISADQAAIGRVQAQQLKALLRADEEVVYVQGPIGTSSAEKRFAAMRAELAGAAPTVSRFHGDWSAESGAVAIRRWLAVFPRSASPTCVVVAQNDDMAIGVRDAWTEWAGSESRANDLRIIGCDGVPDFGHRLVTEGRLTATVIVPSVAGRAIEELIAATTTKMQPTPNLLVGVTSHPDLDSLARQHSAARAGHHTSAAGR